MNISYQQENHFDLDEMLRVYQASDINRPLQDRERMAVMLASANLLITARDNGKLIGVARCLTDRAYVV
ncbi:MAG TPA: GNAT family N-acetyltransferase, partial [Rheinheimera sp.]|nr:GNAT family N-acetyltransferase [Rheinheimera sp.]